MSSSQQEQQDPPLSSSPRLSTILFDVDDTLYDIATGFTAHRNGDSVQRFMVDKLGFPDGATAQALRDEYFTMYHSTAKALTMAEKDGKFPKLNDKNSNDGNDTAVPSAPRFRAEDLANYWAENLDYTMLTPKSSQFKKELQDLPFTLVAFSNGPRNYVRRVLQELDLWDLFGEERLFAVDDVLPYCKPEQKAFRVVLDRVGVSSPAECIMVEDSMKNVRRCKEMGMKTVLVTGTTKDHQVVDVPDDTDPAVDVAIKTIEELRTAAPELWNKDQPTLD